MSIDQAQARVVPEGRWRPIAALITAEAFSITGTRLSTIAIPWLVLVTTGSAMLTGMVALAEMLPYVLLKALGGPVIDRVGAKRTAVVLDGLSVPVLALVPVLHLMGLLSIQLLIPVVVLLGALRGPSDGAKHALVPDVAEQGGVPLERVTGLSGAVERLGSTVGAALAGALVAAIGPVAALAINAGTFCVSALLLSWGVPQSAVVDDRAAGDVAAEGRSWSSRTRAYLAQLGDGWRFLRGEPVVIGITAMVGLTNLLDQAYTVVLVPVWAHQTGGGAGAIGLVFAVFSGFSILGAVVASAWGSRLPRLPVYTVAFLLTGLPRYVALGLGVDMTLLLVILAIGGFASGFINPIISAVIFERIPKPLRGRVSSLNTALCWSLIPFGGVLGGGLVALLGLSGAMVVVGVVYLLVTLMPLVRKSFREFGNRPVAAPPEAVSA